jgi:SAM-dependent methyltransferase
MPFPAGTFDVAICECTLCLLDKRAVLDEMARVVRSGGRVAMHDLFWNEGASEKVKRRLAEYEGEYPETLDGWRGLFAQAGLEDIRVIDRSALKRRWMQDMRSGLGLRGYARLVAHALRRWGISGLWRLLQSERVFESPQLGYAIVVGTKS